MPNCAVIGCGNHNKNTKGKGIKYYKFPKGEEIVTKWITACGRNENQIHLKNATICSTHFEASCFEISLKQKLLNYTPRNERNLKADAIPTLRLPRKRQTIDDNSESSERLSKKRRINESLVIQEKKIVDEQVNMYQSIDQKQIEEIRAQLSIMETKNIKLENNLKKAENEIINMGRRNIQLENYFKQAENEIINMGRRNIQLENNLKQVENEKINMQRKNIQLENDLKEAENKIIYITSTLGKLFTRGRVKRILDPENNCKRWLPEDIASAISLRSVSPKTYPLPALSTLRQWAASFSVNPGILKDVIRLMGNESRILSFDETYVPNRKDTEKKEEQKVGPHKSCQTVMARGLTSNWKQPVFYDFDQPMTENILKSIMARLYGIHKNVRSGFIFVLSSLKSSEDKFLKDITLWFETVIGMKNNKKKERKTRLRLSAYRKKQCNILKYNAARRVDMSCLTKNIEAGEHSISQKNVAATESQAVVASSSKECQPIAFEFVDPSETKVGHNSGSTLSIETKKIKVEKDEPEYVDPQQLNFDSEKSSDILELEKIKSEIKLEDTELPADFKDNCDFVQDIKEENCDFVQDIKEENCDFVEDIKVENCDFAANIKKEYSDFSANIKEEVCDI